MPELRANVNDDGIRPVDLDDIIERNHEEWDRMAREAINRHIEQNRILDTVVPSDEFGGRISTEEFIHNTNIKFLKTTMANRDHKEKYINAILKLYNSASNIFGIEFHFDSYDEFLSYCHQENGKYMIPVTAFYLDKEKQDEICNEAISSFIKKWVYPYKIAPIGDRKYEAYASDLAKYEKEKSSMSAYKRKKAMEELAAKHGLIQKSKAADQMLYDIWNIAPTISKPYFEKLKQYFENNEKNNEKLDHDVKIAKIFRDNYLAAKNA